MLHFVYLYIGGSGPLDADGLNKSDRYAYVLVMTDDLRTFDWLEPTETCTARQTAQHLLTWCNRLDVPQVWISDTISYFKYKIMATLENATWS